MNRRFVRIAGCLMLVLALAACGKKGAPAAPKDQPNVFPRSYPYDASKPTPKADPNAFPNIGNDDTNTDPTQSRSTE